MKSKTTSCICERGSRAAFQKLTFADEGEKSSLSELSDSHAIFFGRRFTGDFFGFAAVAGGKDDIGYC